MQELDQNSDQFERLSNQLNGLYKSLSFSVTQNQVNDEWNQIIANAEEEVATTKKSIEQLKTTRDELRQRMDKLSPVLASIGPLVDQLEGLTKLDLLVDKLETIKQIHNTLDYNVVNARNTKELEARVVSITQLFSQLVAENKLLEESDKNKTLKRYLADIVDHWRRVLLTKFEQNFVDSFESIDWPKTSDEIKAEPNVDSVNTFISYFTLLLTVDIENTLLPKNTDRRNEFMKSVVLPMELMLRPIKKRFQYHFMEAKSKLNRPEKPEWYLSQTLLWIRQNQDFLVRNIDPILKASQSSNEIIPSKLQLICGLLECVFAKLKSDLPSLVYDDKLFSHMVDEVFIFNRELQHIEPNIFHLFPNCNLMDIFSNETLFSRILSLEKKKSAQFVEFILESKTAWNEICGPEGNDELRICESGDNFVLMLQSISNRCAFLNEPSLQYQFVNLELEILDDFRLRLIQLVHNCDQSWPHSNQFFAIINTINYLVVVLDEWKNLPFFVQISDIYRPNGTLFDDTIQLLEHISKEFISQIKFSFMTHLRSKLQNYQTIKYWSELMSYVSLITFNVHLLFRWFCLKSMDNSLSSSVSDLLHTISSNVVLLQKSLANSLFDTILAEIVDQLNKVLFEELILKNSFNELGAKQLEYDLTFGFMPLFRLYMARPEVNFASSLEAVKLLTLERGSSLLLLSLLNDSRNREESRKALKEMSISSLSPLMALNVVKRRIYLN